VDQTERRIRLSEVELDVSQAGPADGPLVFLLHGFPEGRFSWTRQLHLVAGMGRLVVAPDQRGYNRSSKPRGVAAYDLDRLAQDISELAASYGRSRYTVIGHDWGAGVGWWLASQRPQEIEALLALSAPHPAVWRHAMSADPEQRKRSGYVKLLGIPALPELLVRLGGYRGLETPLKPYSLSAEQWASYRAAWREPGALTGMINWYRALLARSFADPLSYRVTAPTLFAYGAEDPFGAEATARLSGELGPNVTVRRLEAAGHWLMHERPDEVDQLVAGFLQG